MLIGQSPEIVKVKRIIREIAKTDSNVLILGEVGTGKKLAAQETHKRSKQKNRALVVVDCSALGNTVTEIDLLGQVYEGERGIERKIGLLEQANRGILYLENFGELSAEYQHKLYNIFKQGRFQKPGEEEFTSVYLRIFAGSTDVQLAQKDTIRRDLLSLVSDFTITIPPLRERKQDIPLLFSHFIETMYEETGRDLPAVNAELFDSLMEYDWLGNVQEFIKALKNVVRMSPEGELAVDYLPFEMKRHPFEFLKDRELPEAVGEVERYLIRKALRRFAGNQSKAANSLNVSEAALRYKMKKYGFNRKAF